MGRPGSECPPAAPPSRARSRTRARPPSRRPGPPRRRPRAATARPKTRTTARPRSRACVCVCVCVKKKKKKKKKARRPAAGPWPGWQRRDASGLSRQRHRRQRPRHPDDAKAGSGSAFLGSPRGHPRRDQRARSRARCLVEHHRVADRLPAERQRRPSYPRRQAALDRDPAKAAALGLATSPRPMPSSTCARAATAPPRRPSASPCGEITIGTPALQGSADDAAVDPAADTATTDPAATTTTTTGPAAAATPPNRSSTRTPAPPPSIRRPAPRSSPSIP